LGVASWADIIAQRRFAWHILSASCGKQYEEKGKKQPEAEGGRHSSGQRTQNKMKQINQLN
jgi:hypothetical protein